MVNEDTIKKRIAALESDIKVMTNTIQEIDAKKQEAIANLNALHGAKQQCESFLKELDNDDQTAQAVAGSCCGKIPTVTFPNLGVLIKEKPNGR